MHKSKIIVIFVLFLSVRYATGQENNLKFEHLTVEDGLSQNTVYDILQDHEGFMWFATQDGLNKYDGYDFKIYKQNPKDDNSLSHSAVFVLFEDSKNNLWIGTIGGGLNRFIREKDCFEHYKHKKNENSLINDNVRDIDEDKRGNLWLGTYGGVSCFNKKTKKFTNYIHLPTNSNSLINNYVWTVKVMKDDEIWIGTDAGISILNPENGNFTNIYPGKQSNGGEAPASVWNIYEDKRHNLWFSSKNGFYTLKSNGEFVRYSTEPDFANIFFPVLEDSRNTLWVGSLGGGLMVFDRDKNTFTQAYTNDIYDRTSLSDRLARSIYEDKFGVLWVGTWNGGVSKNNRMNERFKHFRVRHITGNSLNSNSIRSIEQNHEGKLLIGTQGGGINVYDSDKKGFTHITIANSGLSNNNIFDLYEDDENILWIGTYNGLNIYNPDNNSFTIVKANFGNGSFLTHPVVNVIYEDRFNNVWIGTEWGLNRYDRETQKFEHFIAIPEDSTTLSSSVIRDITEDMRGNLWIATEKGANRYNYQTGEFKRFISNTEDSASLSENTVFCIYPASNGDLWFGTSGGGLNKFDYENETFFCYTEKHGLPNSIIYGILEDDAGNLWISTNGGISKFNPAGETFYNYDKYDGLQSNQFLQGAYYKNEQGYMFFGGVNGFNMFHPDSIEKNSIPPEVVITGFKIMNKKVPVGGRFNGRTILKKAISQTDTIVLTSKDYIFSFEFAALHYVNPEKNRYQYKLENFESEWTTTKADRRFVTYTNLDPDEYVFKVRASNCDGIWSEKTAEVRIIIRPPYWKTWWFRLLALLVFFALAFLLYKMRINRVERQKKYLTSQIKERTQQLELQNEEIESQRDLANFQKEQISKQKNELEEHRRRLEDIVEKRTADLKRAKERAEESDKLKTAFLTNMSHEIRTPLNAIIGFSSLLIEPEFSDEEKKQYFLQIESNVSNLLNLIEDIIDISKIEAGEMNLQKNPVAINRLMVELFTTFKEHLFQLSKEHISIDILLDCKDPDYTIETDEDRLRQVLTNLIENAIKYTENGSIEFGYTFIPGYIRFFVRDTGIGIEEDKIEVIFERFRKIEDKQKVKLYRGAGLGLAISKKIVEILDGKIWVESQIGKGSTFYFTLPHKKKQHMTENNRSIETIGKLMKNDWSDKTILVVEDEEANFQFIKTTLRRTNAQIIWAKDGEEAVDMFKKHEEIDIVLMDIRLPRMDGYDATRIIKSLRKNVPVIAQTAYAIRDEQYDCLEAGCNDYIAKPFNTNDLIQIIKKYLQ